MNAVIYCRVSSRDQIEGTSLTSQEAACRDFAARHGLTVAKVFVEEGESAKFADRTQLLELIQYCRRKSNEVEALVVWKLDRFARNVEDHYAIKATLRRLGVKVMSVTEPIDNDPNGKLMETILAGFAQFDNDIRAMRTVQGMQQRLKSGIWPWHPPLGYLAPKAGRKNEPDRADPDTFGPIQKAWKLLLSGKYSKADIARLLQKWDVHALRGCLVSLQTVDRLFANPYYAGILRDPWTGEEYPGRHEAMVTMAEFAAVRQLIEKRANASRHCRHNPAFPLRGLVGCPSCGQPMTAAFIKGRSQRYPYYFCYRRSCPGRRNYQAASVHQEFAAFLRDTSISPVNAVPVVAGILAVLSDEVDRRRQAQKRRQEDQERIDGQLRELISMRSQQLISDAELTAQRAAVKKQRLELTADEFADTKEPPTQDDIKVAIGSIADLEMVWATTPLEEKAELGRLLLPAGYLFGGIRTADNALLITLCDASVDGESHVAAFVKHHLHQLLHEIRTILSIIGRHKSTFKKAV